MHEMLHENLLHDLTLPLPCNCNPQINLPQHEILHDNLLHDLTIPLPFNYPQINLPQN